MTVEAVAPTAAHPSVAKPRERLDSLDAMRGLTVIGMIVVNSAAYIKYVDRFDSYPVLLHAEWAGFTLADAVFPAFIFMVGASIALSFRASPELNQENAAKIFWRSIRLIVAGLLISNLYWLADFTHNEFRPFGVLQRIGLCYFAAALLYLLASWRVRLALAVLVLVLYWPLCLIPQPDGHATDLYIPGANFVSWFDRAVLGTHAYVKAPLGYDPEGILSTLPAIAQCLLGTLAGKWLLRAPRESVPRVFALTGIAFAAAGLLWSPFFPLIKSIWTSSYVLLSTGIALLVWAACFWLLDVKRARPWGTAFVLAFGVNAIFAYILHELASLMLAGDGMRWFDALASPVLPPKAAALVPVFVFLLIVWLPVAYLYRRRWIIRI